MFYAEGNADMEIEVVGHVGASAVTGSSGLGEAKFAFVNSELTHEPGSRGGGMFIESMRITRIGRPTPPKPPELSPRDRALTGSIQKLNGGWICHCDALNDSTHDVCLRCGCHRPANVYVPQIYRSRPCWSCRNWTSNWEAMRCRDCHEPLHPPL
jgi:hypothetical protein